MKASIVDFISNTTITYNFTFIMTILQYRTLMIAVSNLHLNLNYITFKQCVSIFNNYHENQEFWHRRSALITQSQRDYSASLLVLMMHL